MVANDDCQGLASENAALRAEVTRLQHEVTRLRREVAKLQKRIRRLLEVIRRAKQYALGVYRQAAKAMGKHQPRGTWSLWKGKGEVAREVYNRLGRE
jgi:septal ring factor EnvC (AmiA/AmiB activator)